jgi:O-antigen ligase
VLNQESVRSGKRASPGILWLLSWGLFIIAFGFSLFYNQQYSQYLGLAGIGVLAYLALNAGRMVSQSRPITFSAPVTFAFIFWLWWLVAAQLSPVAYASQATLWGLFVLPATAAAAWWHCSAEPGCCHRLPLILAACGCGLGFFAVYQFFVLESPPQATFINKNSFAALEVMILVVVIGSGYAAALANRSLRWPVLYFGVITFLAFLVGLVASRGALFALVCGVALVTLGGGLLGIGRARIVGVLVAVVAGLLLAGLVNSGALGQKIASLQSPFDVGSGGIRLIIWEASAGMVEGNLWTGIGPGLYWLLYPRFRSPDDPDGGFYAHNDYLQFLIEAGLPALLLLIGLVFFVTWKTFRLALDPAVPGSTRMFAISLWLALASVCGHSMLSFNLYLVPILMVAGLLLGSLGWLISQSGRNADATTGRGYLSLAVLLLLLMFPATFYFKAGSAGFALSEAMAASESGERRAAEDYLAQAISYWPEVDFYRYSLAWSMYTRSKESGESLTPELTEQIFGQLEAAHRLNPLRARSYLIEARVLEALSSQRIDVGGDQVVEAYLEALERNPRLLEARFFYARFLLGRNSIKEGVRVLESGLEWPYPTSVLKMNYYRLTAEMRKINGDMQGYDELMTQVRHIADVLNRRGRVARRRTGPGRYWSTESGSDSWHETFMHSLTVICGC